ncbi:MAG: hypothetical protein KatS3mg110_3684 [Pirellulaceae bacterium]|nr:MAG: hypothetical protein KatS3mg110_3684 [Pirellulaceae bacterium]
MMNSIDQVVLRSRGAHGDERPAQTERKMSNSPEISATEQYLASCEWLLASVRRQKAAIEQAADWFAESIHQGRVVHLFGAGHSRILVEEMWPRYGSFPGFHPIVELSLTFHNQVVGANGQRQAMFLENCPGLAERILRNFALDARDCALLISSSGVSVVTVEMAELFRRAGIRVVALVSVAHSRTMASRHPRGLKLPDVADLVLDTGAPPGDAVVRLAGVETPIAPVSTVGGALVVNAIKAEVASRLASRGALPPVLAAANVVGPDRSRRLFEEAYDEHGRRLGALLAGAGASHSGRAQSELPS